MKNNPFWKIAFCAALAALLLVACAPKSLPGESGMAVEYTGNTSEGIKLRSAFMSPIPITPGEAVYSAKGLPSGIPQFVLGIIAEISTTEVTDFKLDYQVFNNTGLVKTEIVGKPANWTDPDAGQTIIMFTVRPEGKTVFPDGPYQAKLLIDKKVVALLNWTIGSGTP